MRRSPERTTRARRFLAGLIGATAALVVVGCDRDPACASAPETCQLPDACAELAFPPCDAPGASARFIEEAEPLTGPSALGAVGDVLLQNGQVRLVIDALDNPNHIAPTGGSILDFETRGDDNDTLNHIWGGTGPLPADAIAYTALRIENNGDSARVIVTGHLVGDERNKAATVYTLKSCEPGVHVTTEIKNASDEEAVWAVQDGFWWGTKSNLPFIPNSARGHTHPDFGLGNINAVFTASPFLVGSSHHTVGASYVSVGCNVSALEGFHSTQVSAFGAPRAVVAPGDYITFSRFIAAAPGPGVQPAADIGYDVRQQLFDEPRGELRGRLTGLDDESPRGPTEVVLFAGPRPATIVEPDRDGRFSAHMPQTEAGLYEVLRFGRVVRRGSFDLQGDEDNVRTDLGNIPVAPAAQLSLSVAVSGVPAAAQVFITPADDATRAQTEARFRDNGPVCAPMLGSAYGASPACHRILVDGDAVVSVPPGRYRLTATKGLLYALATTDIDVAAGDAVAASFSLRRVIDTGSGGPLGPVLGGDFHVHGERSYDASIPDETRALSLLAAGIEVIAATDHDAIGDYSAALAAIGATGRIAVMGGLEATPNVLFSLRADVTYPQVIGHWNFWPLEQDLARPRKGAPWDEVAEPGALFERVAEAGLPPHGIRQMNHPTSGNNFGRPQGWTYALGLRTDEPFLDLPGTGGAGLFTHQPAGAAFANDDFDTIEVLNGTSGRENAAHIALWFHLLNHGVVKAGTASSDSHALTDSIVGSPRTLVFGDNDAAALDEVAFQEAVKAGCTLMTNGPLFAHRLEQNGTPSPRGDIHTLHPVSVSSEIVVEVHAAPYVPASEVRLLHNGIVVARQAVGAAEENPYAQTTAPRGSVRFNVADVLDFVAPETDAWLLVEVGPERLVLADLDCDSYPDTTDNDDDGVIDWRDVDRNGDGAITDADLDRTGDGIVSAEDAPASCSGGKGPVRTWCDSHEDAPYCVVTPGAHPLAMSQPMFFDGDGDGRFTPPGVVASGFAPVAP